MSGHRSVTGLHLRRRAARALEDLRDQLAEDDPATPSPDSGADTPSAEPASAAAPVEVTSDDVQIDAFRVLQQLGVGVAFEFVDVREPSEVKATGHIEGAHTIPLGELEDRADELDPEATVVLYCASGGRSTHGALLLRRAGFSSTWSLVGGVTGWRREGGELVIPS